MVERPALFVNAVQIDRPIPRVQQTDYCVVQIIDVAGSNRHLRAKGVSLGHVILRGRDSKIIAARAVREDAAGIVELLISVNADGERQVLCPLIQKPLYLRAEVQRSVCGHRRFPARRPWMMQAEGLRHEVVEDLVDQLDFQQRLTADKVKNDPGNLRGRDVLICPLVCGEQHIDGGLGGFKRHLPVRLAALIAVAAAQVAVFRYLKCNALGVRRVDAKLDTRHGEKPRQHIGEGFLWPSHRSAPAASPSPWRSRNQAPSQPLHCRRQE